ncbi:MAG: hypothetical protein ACP5XB_09605 [Isosphaeraceae bacterium]
MSMGATVARKATVKKTGRPAVAETRRFGTLVRIADEVAADAKVVASLPGVGMAEYLSDTLRPILKKEIVEELRKREGGAK